MLTCDRCGAPAVWAFLGDAGTLLLCTAHTVTHELALTTSGFSKGLITPMVRT